MNSHNHKTRFQRQDFNADNYVRNGEEKLGLKLQLRCSGTSIVVNCIHSYAFEFEDLLIMKKHILHLHRRPHFSPTDYKDTEDLQVHLVYQKGTLLLKQIILYVREASGHILFLIKCYGFDRQFMDRNIVSTRRCIRHPDQIYGGYHK